MSAPGGVAAEAENVAQLVLDGAEVRGGGRVELPNRDYLLYGGPVEAALATVGLGVEHQVANLWCGARFQAG